MDRQNKVTGVILAGGMARRMNNQDKGLVLFHNKPLVSYAVASMSQVTETVLINANRNKQAYKQFKCQVITDHTETFDGPLAGVLSAMTSTQTEDLIVMPCDSPLIKAEHLNKLLSALKDSVEIAVAFDGQRLHPVFLALKTALQSSLQDYLQAGNRKIDTWLKQHDLVEVDFSQNPEIFININTLPELEALEKSQDE